MQKINTHIPFPMPWDSAPVDISFVFDHEKPAGKHGFLKTKGDQFVFEDGTQLRFWGTNFNSGANFPEHSHSEKVAKRLSAMGQNVVRFHQLDAEWSTPNLFQFAKGPRVTDTSSFDPRSMDRLDYLIHCLREEGIYMYMDMITYREFRSDEGVENAVALNTAAKPYTCYSRKLIELQKKFNEELWNHVNPYTGLAYKDDPAIILTEITNENDVFAKPIEVEPYRTEFEEGFLAWAKANSKSTDELIGEDGRIDPNTTHETMTAYKVKVLRDYYREMHAHCRSIGVKIPITGTNWFFNPATLEAHNEMDFTDNHDYTHIAQQISFTNKTLLKQKRNMLSVLAFGKVEDKPFFVSEWDENWPSKYRANTPILMAAGGCLQGWGGFTIHTYRYGTSEKESITSRLGRDLVLGGSYYRGAFDDYNDPAKFGLFYHAALIMRRGDVRMGEKLVALEAADHKSSPPFHRDNIHDGFDFGPEIHRVVTRLPGYTYTQKADLMLKRNEPAPWKDLDEFTSDTGEIYRNAKGGYGHVDTPMTKAVYGFHAHGNEYALSDLSVHVENTFGTVAISSLTDQPINNSDNMLLTAVGLADNKGAQYAENHTVQISNGTGPITIEVIQASIRMKTSVQGLRVRSVDYEGFYTGEIPSRYEDGCYVFDIGGEFASMYYLIQKQ